MRLSRKPGSDASTGETRALDAANGESFAQPSAPPEYAKSTGRWVTLLALLTAVGLTGGFFAVSRIRAREAFELDQQTHEGVAMLPLVDVATAEPGPAFRSLVLPGETAAWYRTTLYSRVNGYLADWKVDIGDRVKQGQVLATIDTPDLDAQLDAAKAELTASQAETKVKQADADFARSSYDRWRDSPKGVVSDQEREEKKAGNDSSVAKLNAAVAKVAVDQARVDGLTTLTQFKNVTAPFVGIITDRRVDPGDLVSAGSASNTTPLFIIQQIDKLRVFANVPQSVAARISVGSPATITASDDTGRTFNGKITRTTGSVDPRARTMLVEVDLPNADGRLSPGMYVRAAFDVAQAPSVRVPASAIIFRGKGPQVAIVGKDGTIKFRDVSIASDDGDFLDLAAGVKVGEDVALNINSQISNGDKVAINNPSGAES